jgi:predicted amidophosphoribosyltransferase
MEQPATAGGRCPSCGAQYRRGASLCTFCGSPLTTAQEERAQPTGPGDNRDSTTFATITLASPQPRAEPGREAISAPSEPAAGSMPPVAGGAHKRCAWCGTLNADAEQSCQQCGAAFPRPEQDEALLRASQERIRTVTDSITTIRKERARRGLGRLFGR